jgi:FhaA, N-terminal domain/FHA domain
MNIFKDFEKTLEGLFEGVFLRAFKSGVQPVELGKKLVREMEGHKTIGVSSHVYVPNRYEVGLSPQDYSRFELYQAVMATELENLLISYIKDKGYAVLDRPRIKLVEVERLREGEFWIKTSLEGEVPTGHGADQPRQGGRRAKPSGPPVLELLDSGEVSPIFAIEKESIRLGRVADNDIVLPDPNVSRVHARVWRRDDSFFVTDLSSTNGTWVNEERISEAELKDEDVIRLGSTRLIFRRSQE